MLVVNILAGCELHNKNGEHQIIYFNNNSDKEVMFQFVCPKRDPHFKELSKLHVLFHTMNNTNHIFIN